MEKTGKFKCQVWVPEAGGLEQGRRAALIQLMNNLTHQLEDSMQDGRAYELMASFSAWTIDFDGGWPAGYERKQVEFTLVLLDSEQAEMGEWVKDLSHYVPDKTKCFAFGDGTGEMEGRVFERGDFGWKRVE